MKKKFVEYPLRIESDMMKEIRRLANQGDRSLAAQLRRLLKWALERMGNDAKNEN